jgi:hypothetical protein
MVARAPATAVGEARRLAAACACLSSPTSPERPNARARGFVRDQVEALRKLRRLEALEGGGARV